MTELLPLFDPGPPTHAVRPLPRLAATVTVTVQVKVDLPLVREVLAGAKSLDGLDETLHELACEAAEDDLTGQVVEVNTGPLDLRDETGRVWSMGSLLDELLTPTWMPATEAS